MEGRAIARPNRATRARAAAEFDTLLQWRAGQLPGQTRDTTRICVPIARLASMEGRAIARPNRRRGCRCGSERDRASMEGRAIARPNLWLIMVEAVKVIWPASMEGRAIARPNDRGFRTTSLYGAVVGFNGGPGNCPAKPTWTPDFVMPKFSSP